eukprot:113834_1
MTHQSLQTHDEIKTTDPNDHDIDRQVSLSVYVGVHICGMSHVDPVNETFRLTMHFETKRELSPKENELYKSDPLNFQPSLYVSIEPRIISEIVHWEFTKYNTGDEFIVVQNEKNHKINGEYMIMRLIKTTIEFCEDFELQKFPFDVQHLGFNFQFRSDKMDIPNSLFAYKILKSSAIYLPKRALDNNEWNVVGLQCSVDNQSIINYQNKLKEGKYSRCVCTYSSFCIIIKRKWKFYFDRVVVVLAIISLMANFVFLFDSSDSIGNKFSYISTMLLTAIAFMLVTNEFIPPLQYLTILDQYVLAQFIFIFIIAIEIAIGDGGLDDGLNDLNGYLLAINFSIWLMIHLIFIVLSYKAYQNENKKIDMIKEEVDDIYYNNNKQQYLAGENDLDQNIIKKDRG